MTFGHSDLPITDWQLGRIASLAGIFLPKMQIETKRRLSFSSIFIYFRQMDQAEQAGPVFAL